VVKEASGHHASEVVTDDEYLPVDSPAGTLDGLLVPPVLTEHGA
jgi:hypothetical protein